MINNRQGGRRRGRGGQRGQNIGGQPGNRSDNRQRGNAAQLLEKYKNMARDAQLAGDRVQTEYFLQFADHYYRVLGENRARFEDQRRQRGADGDEEEGEDELIEAEGGEEQGDSERPERPARQERRPQRERGDREDRPRRYSRDDRDQDDRGERKNEERAGNDERMPFEALPPAIGAAPEPEEPGEGAEVVEARPRRRTRRPRPEEGDEEIAPAA